MEINVKFGIKDPLQEQRLKDLYLCSFLYFMYLLYSSFFLSFFVFSLRLIFSMRSFIGSFLSIEFLGYRISRWN